MGLIESIDAGSTAKLLTIFWKRPRSTHALAANGKSFS